MKHFSITPNNVVFYKTIIIQFNIFFKLFYANHYNVKMHYIQAIHIFVSVICRKL